MTISEKSAVLFWSKVDKSGACWNWLGALTDFGHGQVRVAYRLHRAHRVSWEMEHGPIAEGLCVLHRCDNPRCVRPSHLFLGTKRDNTADMMSKGRGRYVSHSGEQNASSKLSAAQVREIRIRYGLPRGRGRSGVVSQKALAIEFGVAQTLIGAIVRREVWR